MEHFEAQTLLEKLRQYGLMPRVRERVINKRAKKALARDTLYRAFSLDESERTPLHRFILSEAKDLLAEHEEEISEPATS